ncbi:MAG: GGDEF domain-containing protein [Dehalobacter sp.]|nr:GGDEF domain-containing protein [Dehalobacter sp.]
MTTSISTDVLAIIILCFAIYLAKRNIVVNNYKNKIYIFVSLITIILLLLEITTILMELSSNKHLVIPHRIANIIGFSLCPVVPYILLFFNSKREKGIFANRILALPLYFNAFVCISSYKTGWIFFVDAQNQYTRGNLFLLPTIISIFYFVLMVITVIEKSAEFEKNDKIILSLICFIPIIGIIIQILFKEILVIWGSVSISLLIYYIFLRESQFKHDVQTELNNRSAFEKEMDQFLKGDKDAAIVVVDINNLKSINDKYGHKVGDEIIYHAAKIIQESFSGIGKAFRIGGDEFCIICKETSREQVDSALTNLDHFLFAINEKRDIKIVLAYGYSFYIKNENESIYSTFTQADKAMYTHKAKLKGFYGRSVDD